MATFYKGDCLDQMKRLPAESVDLILWDPPFGITQCEWDSKLDWPKMFAECFRVLKRTGMLVIHCSIPFNYTLIRSAPKPPNYSWYWTKVSNTNPFLAPVQPLRTTEEILVWRKERNTYYPQRVGTEERTHTCNGTSAYYNPPTKKPTKKTVIGHYQTHHLTFKRPPSHGKNAIHKFGTRPEEMIELLIKSYTKEGDVVLDPTCHLGISGKVARRLKRRWIGMDLYFYPTLLITS